MRIKYEYGTQKYHSKKTTASDGKVFDSKREAGRYEQLRLLEKAGEITNLRLQVPFELIPAQYETYERYGKRGQRLKDGVSLLEKGVEYIADFVYKDAKTGVEYVEDAKGVRTKEYIIKRKLMLYVHGIKIREI
jgi:hypothetical protein